MTSPTVLPGVVQRVLREAAGRRALRLALLVGGLIALGFLCGGQAQAAEGTPTAVTEVTAALSGPVRTSAPVPATDPVPVPVPVPVVHVERVLRPVREVVTAVTEQVAQASAELPLPTDLPALPDLPLPELPDLTELPDVSEPPSLPVQNLPVPVTQAPAPDSPVASSPDGHRSRHVAPQHEAADAATVSYGPVLRAVLGDAAGPRAASHHDPAPARAGQVPAHRAPGGEPSGLLGGSSALDGGVSRHGDAQAVTVSHRMPVLLVSGGVVRSEAAETRDVHRDIPVFPG
ncbi:hypothetical protein ACH4U3_07420 [Streptomyces griseoruber]|uniref:hypothetical protein n=1 Tax=Streptomyces griseoruber TaxID=1943 RepID=UPI0037B12099